MQEGLCACQRQLGEENLDRLGNRIGAGPD